LQRLFSTFANGWPGFGLFIQRLAIGIALLHNGIMQIAVQKTGSAMLEITGAIAGTLLLVGLWTPIAGALAAGIESWIVFSGTGDAAAPIMLAVLGGTLAMIGPGAWSIDARLFGRKHLAG
jgi:putative oxidoreductase